MQLIMLSLLLCGADPSQDVQRMYEERTYVYTGGPYTDEQFKYRLMPPENVEPGKRYPLIVFLHGAGERGSDNAKQLIYFPTLMADEAHRKKFPCFVFAPQCKDDQWWSNGSDLQGILNKQPVHQQDALNHQLQVVMKVLDELLDSLPIDPDRVYLTGLSMGGFAAWDLATRFPERFAAVAPICAGGDLSKAERLVDVPLWAFHGARDNVVAVEYSRTMIDAIKAAGGEPKYTEFAEADHNSWTPAYQTTDVIDWMFKLVNDRRKSDRS